MRLGTRRPEPPAEQLRKLRAAAARRVPAWTEIPPDLVRRGPGWYVSAETDQIYTAYRGTVWATGSAQAVSDTSKLCFFVDPGGDCVFLEQQPGTWSELVARRAGRQRSTA